MQVHHPTDAEIEKLDLLSRKSLSIPKTWADLHWDSTLEEWEHVQDLADDDGKWQHPTDFEAQEEAIIRCCFEAEALGQRCHLLDAPVNHPAEQLIKDHWLQLLDKRRSQAQIPV